MKALPRYAPSKIALDLVKIAAVAVVYFAAGKLGLRLALIEKNVTPVWPPTGIALAALLYFGYRVTPGIAFAAFLVNAPISPSLRAAAAIAVGNTLAPILAAYLLRRVGFRRELDRLRDAMAIVLLAGLVSMSASAFVGAGTLVLSGAIPSSAFGSTLSVWWAGDAMGILVVCPFLLSLGWHRRLRAVPFRRVAEAITLFSCLALVSGLAFYSSLQFLYLVFPFLIWAVWRFQQRGAVPAVVLVSSIAIWAALHGSGPFAGHTLFEKMVTLQVFNAVVAFTSFVLAALMTERAEARDGLERAAVEQEERIRARTAQLSAANEQLEREIADHKWTDQQLRETWRQLVEAQKIANIGNWEWHIPTDRIIWSDELYEIYGLDPNEFDATYEGFLKYIHPDDRGFVDEALKKAVAEHTSFAFDHRIIRPDGTQRILNGRGEVFPDASGSPVRIAGTAQDITERKRAEQALQLSEERWRSVIDASPDFICVVDNEGRIQFLNRGDSLNEGEALLGMRVFDYVDKEFHPGMTDAMRRLFEAGEDVSLEVSAPGRHGPASWYEIRAVPLWQDGSVVAAMTVSRDITERRRLDEERERAARETAEALRRLQHLDELKSDFLSTVSHELRTPLTSIQGFSSLLAGKWNELQEPARRDFLGRVEANARRLGRVINELLDFSRLERGNIDVEIASLDLAEEVTRVIEDLGTLLDAHRIVVRVPSGLNVMADSKAFTRVLENLITNAVKFSPRGSQIVVEAKESDGEVLMEVEDEGPGVPEKERDRIFERFYRVDRRETAAAGTGIGLAIAKEYAEAQGGRIWVEGAPEGGSIFCFTLKRAAEASATGIQTRRLSAKAS